MLFNLVLGDGAGRSVENWADQGVASEFEPEEFAARRGVSSVSLWAPDVNGTGGAPTDRDRVRFPSSWMVARLPNEALPREDRDREEDRPRGAWVVSASPVGGERCAMCLFFGRTVVQSVGGESDILAQQCAEAVL